VSEEPPPVRCGNQTTWRHKGEKIDLPRLLQLIEERGRPDGLDLHGCVMTGIDASPQALRRYVHAHRHGDLREATPPWLWLGGGGGLNLRGAHLEEVDLEDARLQSANLDLARLHKARLSRAQLENADLQRAHLQHATLRGAQLNGAHLSLARLQDADLGGAHLQSCYLRHAQLQRALLANADLRYAHLHRANLEHARLPRAQLRSATLGGAQLTRARLESADLRNAYLREARLEGARLEFTHLEGANLEHAHLEHAALRGACLENARLWSARLNGATWYGSYLNRTGFRRQQLGPAIGDELAAKGRGPDPATFLRAREAYLSLKNNFDSIGRYDDASWAYVKEQQMDKAVHFPTTAGHRWIRSRLRRRQRGWRRKHPSRLRRFMRASILSRLQWAWLHLRLFGGLCPPDTKRAMKEAEEERIDRPRWLRTWAYELLTGYGERPIRPLLWAAVLSVLAFPLLYWATGALPGHGRAFTSPAPSTIDWAGWGQSIIFSLTSFGTLSFGRLQPDGALANILAALEAFAGVLAFALFVFTLGNRMRRS
jgi:uncharacterized protein YjbI with pentapeptide repeats